MELKECVANNLGKGLDDDQLDRFVALGAVKDFSGGDVIIRQLGKDSDLVVLLEGKVRVFGFNDKELREAGAGSVFGEVSLVDKQPRSASVRSAGPTKAAIFDADEINALLKSDPQIAAVVFENIAKVLCSRLRQATIEIDCLMAC